MTVLSQQKLHRSPPIHVNWSSDERQSVFPIWYTLPSSQDLNNSSMLLPHTFSYFRSSCSRETPPFFFTPDGIPYEVPCLSQIPPADPYSRPGACSTFQEDPDPIFLRTPGTNGSGTPACSASFFSIFVPRENFRSPMIHQILGEKRGDMMAAISVPIKF